VTIYYILLGIAAVLTAGTPGLLAWRQGKASHALMNSRLDALVEITRRAARAKGRLEGRAEEKKRRMG